MTYALTKEGYDLNELIRSWQRQGYIELYEPIDPRGGPVMIFTSPSSVSPTSDTAFAVVAEAYQQTVDGINLIASYKAADGSYFDGESLCKHSDFARDLPMVRSVSLMLLGLADLHMYLFLSCLAAKQEAGLAKEAFDISRYGYVQIITGGLTPAERNFTCSMAYCYRDRVMADDRDVIHLYHPTSRLELSAILFGMGYSPDTNAELIPELKDLGSNMDPAVNVRQMMGLYFAAKSNHPELAAFKHAV